MEGNNTKKVFIWLMISVLVMQIVPVTITGDTWVQTTQEDFEGGQTWNTNVTLSPGNVTLEPSSTDWIKGQGNPVIDVGPAGCWDNFGIGAPSILYNNGTYKIWYVGTDSGPFTDKIGYATSTDGFIWEKHLQNPVLNPSPPVTWDDYIIDFPEVIYNGKEYLMYYHALSTSAPDDTIGVANSSDGINWIKNPLNPVLNLGSSGLWDDSSIHDCSVVFRNGLYQMWYTGSTTGGIDAADIGYATSVDGYNWTKYLGNPVFSRGGAGAWDSSLVALPSVWHDGSEYHLWYTGRDAGGNFAFGYATSNDGINWTKYPNNPILTPGSVESWDNSLILGPNVVKINNTFRMWYWGDDGSRSRIGHAFSYDGINWEKRAINPILNIGNSGEWDDSGTAVPSVLKIGSIYKMWYHGIQGGTSRIGYAESLDGIYWTKYGSNPVLDLGAPTSWDDTFVGRPNVVYDDTEPINKYKMWYTGGQSISTFRIGFANSSDGINWNRYSGNPVLGVGSPGSWDNWGVLSPFVIKDGNIYKMWYVGFEGDWSTYPGRIGYAESTDGLNWIKYSSNPVLNIGSLGSWDDFGVGNPIVTYDNDLYEMWYSGNDGSNQRIGYATSIDGFNWTKHANNPIIDIGESGSLDDYRINPGTVMRQDHTIKMWYYVSDGTNNRIGYATAAYGSHFIKEPSNPVLDLGPAGSWDDFCITEPSILYSNGIYKMWYVGTEGGPWTDKIGYATSTDGMVWDKYFQNPVLNPSPPIKWDDYFVSYPRVIFNGEEYLMYYHGFSTSGPNGKIGVANSSDGINWIKNPLNPVIDIGPSGSWDDYTVHDCSVVYHDGLYEMWYTGSPTGGIENAEIGYATSSDGYNWTKYPGNPVIPKGGIGTWDFSLVALPNVWYDGNVYQLWYTGRDAGGNYRIGYANSIDGINWTKYPNNPILTPGSGGSWDDVFVLEPHVIKINDTYRMWYRGHDGSRDRIGHALSDDGINWTKRAVNPIMDVGKPGSWDDNDVNMPSILFDGSTHKMWYAGYDGTNYQIGYATSNDGKNWLKESNNPVLSLGLSGEWDDYHVSDMDVLFNGTGYKMWYSGHDGTNYRIGYATSPNGINWMKSTDNPIIDLGTSGSWEDEGVSSPSVLYEHGIYKMWYSGFDGTNRRIGYATSLNGINWTKHSKNPVLNVGSSGSWDESDSYHPYVIFEDGIYKIWYTGNNGVNWGMGFATSSDGIYWTKSKINPILKSGPVGTWDDNRIYCPMIIKNGTSYNMIFTGYDGTNVRMGIAKSDYTSTGTFDSTIFDSGIPGTTWNSISWSEILPPNTLIALSIRTGNTSLPDSSWTNWSDEIYNSIGSIITQPQSRYIQYRATLISLDAKDTPILEDVTINYGLNSALSPTLITPSSDLWTTNNNPTFTWTFSDPNGDIQGGYEIEIDDDQLFTSVDLTSGDVLTIGEEWTPSLAMSDGAWFWRVKTMDEYGLWSNWSEVWSVNIDTTAPDPPINPNVNPDSWTNINSFVIDWTDPIDFSGVKDGCWYKIGSPPTSNSDGTWTDDKPLTITSLEGEQTVYIWLEDIMGNVNYLNYSSLKLYLDSVLPSVLHTPPTSGIYGEPLTIDAVITDNLIVKTATLYYRKTGDSEWSNVIMTKDGDDYSAEIPASFITMTGMQYYIEASDEINTVQYPSLAPPNNYFNLTIQDVEPPIISHTPTTNKTENQTITISATITDNVGVTGAVLFYRIKGTSTWLFVPMTQTGNVFSADIPASAVTPDNVEYYIFATDGTFNTTHPDTNPQTSPHEITVAPAEESDDSKPDPKETEDDFLTTFWWLLLLLFIVVVLIVFLLSRRREQEVGIGPIAEETTTVEPEETISEEIPQEPEEVIDQPETDSPEEEPEPTKAREELGTAPKPVPPLTDTQMNDNEIFDSIKKKFEDGKISEETFEDFKKRYNKE